MQSKQLFLFNIFLTLQQRDNYTLLIHRRWFPGKEFLKIYLINRETRIRIISVELLIWKHDNVLYWWRNVDFQIRTVNGVVLISWRQKVLEKQIDYGAKLGQVVLSLARMELNNFYKNVMPVAEYFDQSNMLVSVSINNFLFKWI